MADMIGTADKPSFLSTPQGANTLSMALAMGSKLFNKKGSNADVMADLVLKYASAQQQAAQLKQALAGIGALSQTDQGQPSAALTTPPPVTGEGVSPINLSAAPTAQATQPAQVPAMGAAAPPALDSNMANILAAYLGGAQQSPFRISPEVLAPATVFGVENPAAAVQTALQVHTAAGQAARQQLAGAVDVVSTLDKMAGRKEERALRETQMAETRRHNLATEAGARDALRQRGEESAALMSYRQGLLDLRKEAVRSAGDKALSTDTKSAWKEFSTTTGRIAQAARSKSGIIPFELYDTWANQALKLKSTGESVSVTIPIIEKNRFSADQTIEVTPEQWLALRKHSAKYKNVTPGDLIKVARELGWVAGE